MVEEIQAIDSEILKLKEQLNQVRGKETEVYSRIVGYYRSVKNWNVGKRGEYRERQTFTELTGRSAGELQRDDSVSSERTVKQEESGSIKSYTYFYRTSCPNCPPMKNILENLDMKKQSFNVDSDEGMAQASELHIFSAPTVVFFDKNGKEVFRTGNPADVEDHFLSSVPQRDLMNIPGSFGFQKTSLVDYPGKVAAVLFFPGCNLRCPYCHNPDLVYGRTEDLISGEEILDYLKFRAPFWEGWFYQGGSRFYTRD